jgi:hypothetical protein
MLNNYVVNENKNLKNKIPKTNNNNVNEVKTDQLNDLKLYGGIYSSSIALVRFILEILKNINEATASINEDPTYIKNLILKYFGSNITTALEKEIDKYVAEQSNIYESEIDGNMSSDE